MKKFSSLLLAFLLIVALIPASVVVFGSDPTYATCTALIPTTAPTIDGDGSDSAWAMADWNYVNKVLQDDDPTDANGAPGSAKFKVTHDVKYIYFYIEVEDDSFSMWDNIQIGFSDVRIDNIGPNNAITFRNSATDTFEVTNGQGAGRAESESSITVIDTKGVNTESGYRIEAKFEYAGFIYGNTNVNFQVQMEDAGRAYLLWNMNEYTLIASNTSDYGELIFNRHVNYSVPFATTAPTVDGTGSDSAWSAAEWNPVAQLVETPEYTGSAKFKAVHDGEYVYFLFEVADDAWSMWDGVGLGFSDDRVAGDAKVGPNNVVYFRNSAENTLAVENTPGANGFQGAVRECDNLVTVIDSKIVNTEAGYVLEAKLQLADSVSDSVYFNVYVQDADRAHIYWNPYWGWNIYSWSTECYGSLSLAEGQNGDNNGGNTDGDDNANTFDFALITVVIAAVSGMGIAVSKKPRR